MTKKQLEREFEIARKTGEAKIDDCTLSFDGKWFSLWHIVDHYKQTIQTGYRIEQFYFLID